MRQAANFPTEEHTRTWGISFYSLRTSLWDRAMPSTRRQAGPGVFTISLRVHQALGVHHFYSQGTGVCERRGSCSAVDLDLVNTLVTSPSDCSCRFGRTSGLNQSDCSRCLAFRHSVANRTALRARKKKEVIGGETGQCLFIYSLNVIIAPISDGKVSLV